MSTASARAAAAPAPNGHHEANGHADTKGMRFPRHFCPDVPDGEDPLDRIAWTNRDALIVDGKGREVFRQDGVEAPASWSQLAVNVVASKYFYGRQGTPERETSVRQLVTRVAQTIANWGRDGGYFHSDADGLRFVRELAWMLANQYGSFNSPVWFNVGLYHEYGVKGTSENWRWDGECVTETRAKPFGPVRCAAIGQTLTPDDMGLEVVRKGKAVRTSDAYAYPQASACFIQSVDDDMGSIMRLAQSEAMLFKCGSGTGSDLSTLRSTKDRLSGGGRPSGPVSFMRIYDAVAAVIKSGGKSRRAAKLQTLKVWHPDIMEFVHCKVKEDAKARALIAAGYSAGMTGHADEAYSSVCFQNSNISVRATDDFMRRATSPDPKAREWVTRAVTTGEPVETMDAGYILDEVAKGAHVCGDPGIQFEDTIQRWHTCPNTAPINSANPCIEFNFIDESACNLSSLNLMRFRRDDGAFDTDGFRHAVRVFTAAMEVIVDNASYPTERICENSHLFRPLGLGYANLGALLMANGLAYDSDEGRSLAGAVTALMHGEAYLASADMARVKGAFDGFAINREPMLRVMDQHVAACVDGRKAAHGLIKRSEDTYRVWLEADRVMDAARAAGSNYGYRNSQISLLAPTGTIAFKMDCATTGVEPDIALVKYKSLAGGGVLKISNQTVPMALRTLGYDEPRVAGILDYIEARDTVEGAPGLKPEHLPVFDCAFEPPQGGRSISWQGHVKMMAAVQPFLSGAISKTVNMPASATPEDIREVYVEAWRLGVKALAVYRDGSKGAQPLNTKADPKDQTPTSQAPSALLAAPVPRRERLPATRQSITHHFNIDSRHDGYFTVGFFPDGRPGELFVKMSREGSTLAGLMDSWATAVSIGLQYGVPLEVFVRKFSFVRFEPAGFTGDPDVPIAKSIVDYVARWIGCRYVAGFREDHAPAPALEPVLAADAERGDAPPPPTRHDRDRQARSFQSDAPPCAKCGALTVRRGACYACDSCGSTSGCG